MIGGVVFGGRAVYVHYMRQELLTSWEWTLEGKDDEVVLRPTYNPHWSRRTSDQILLFPETTHLDMSQFSSRAPVDLDRVVEGLPSLRVLELGGEPLSSLPKPGDLRVRELSLLGTHVNPAQLEMLSRSPGIEILCLSAPRRHRRRLTPDFAPAFAGFGNLRSLEIRQAEVSIECVRAIARLPKLRRLRVSGVELPDRGWEELATSPVLRTIEMGVGSMLPDQVGQLADSRTIENLVFENHGDDLFLPSHFLLRAAELPTLKRFEVRYGRFDKVPFDRVTAQRPDLEVVGEVNPPRPLPGEH